MRAIDADNFKSKYRGRRFHFLRNAINREPTIDLKGTRFEGRWQRHYDDDDGFVHHRCSLCKTNALFEYIFVPDYDEDLDGEWVCIGERCSDIDEHLTKFCPECGADLRRKNEDMR